MSIQNLHIRIVTNENAALMRPFLIYFTRRIFSLNCYKEHNIFRVQL